MADRLTSTPRRAVADWLTPTRRRAIRDGLLLAGLIFNVVLVVAWGPSLILWVDVPSWRLIDLAHLYDRAEESLTTWGAFRFSPAVAWLMYPLAILPWSAFFVVFLSANLVALTVLGRRHTLVLVLAFPPVLLELLNGNIHLFLALAIWAGIRWPAAWAFVLLTKVTPGVGVVWFAARSEWQKLAVAVGATALIVAGGWLVAPDQWFEWVRSLAISAGQPAPSGVPPLVLRLPLGALVAWYAGRTDRAWLVPFACLVAMPTPWLQSSALLVASVALWRDGQRARRWLAGSAAGRELAAA
jgi:hypothetical protein